MLRIGVRWALSAVLGVPLLCLTCVMLAPGLSRAVGLLRGLYVVRSGDDALW